jgi:RNA polymerase-binding transcription factor DksA
VNKSDLGTYRDSLLVLGRRLDDDFAQIHDEALRQAGGDTRANLSHVPLHLADLGADSFEQDIALGLLETEGQILMQVKEALDRIDDGTYGDCQECQEPIPSERLRAVPYTLFCVDCARAYEQEQMHRPDRL